MMLVIDKQELVTGLRIRKAYTAGVPWLAVVANTALGATCREVFVREREKVSKVLSR
jgi:hypothetical protein